MAISRKAVLAALAGATLLSGCATYYDPYDPYGYGYGGRYGYSYGGPAYYEPYYVAPSVGLGFTYSDRDYRHHHRDRDWRRDRDDRRDDRRDRWVDRNNDGRPDPIVPDGVNRGGDLGTGRDPRANPNNSPG